MLPSGGNKRSTSARPTAIWWVLGALFILALGQAYLLTPSGRQVPYSEFKSMVRNGEVAEVTVGESTIHGQLKRGQGEKGSTAFATTRIDDPKLVEDLETHTVKYSGEVVSRWLPEILSWVVPLVLLVALWSFFFRRIGGAEGGVMSFARSKA